ncbi:unnamed protein product [Amaranthus hypochondriacus]
MTIGEETPLDSRDGSFEEITDKNGVVHVIIRNSRGASVRISLYGGQVLSWRNEQGEELLFMSSRATFKPPNAVRGGIPICFPQFGSKGLLEQHGFARNRMWTIDDQPPSPKINGLKGHASVDLVLKPSEEDYKVWANRFEIRLRVTLTEENSLIMRSRVKNVNGKPFNFSFAFRTYFAISDISEVRVEGLETLDYFDCLQDRQRFTEQGDALTFESEIDRIYLSSSDVVALFDHGSKRTFQIRKQGLPDVAVWNPWEKKAKALQDLGDDEYKKMLCVDGAAIEKPITLKPEEEWSGLLELSVLSSC